MQRLTAMVAVMLGLTLAASSAMADKAPPREDPKPEEKPKEDPAAPWTIESMRKSWGDGVAFEFELSSDGKPDGGMKLEVEKVTDKGFVGVTVSISADGDEKVEKDKEKTWEQYMDEFKARLKGATVTDEEIKVPCGTYATKRYTVPTAGSTASYWVSKAVPGMFIKAENRSTRDGKEISQVWKLFDIGVPMVRLPWTRKQIIESWKDGVKLGYEVAAGVEEGSVVIDVTAVDALGFTATQSTELNGEKSTKESAATPWNRFLHKINLPRKGSKISEETIETPAGTFVCMVVSITSEQTTPDDKKSKVTRTQYLAKEEPGLLVKSVLLDENDGHLRTESLTLTEFKKGK